MKENIMMRIYKKSDFNGYCKVEARKKNTLE